MQTLLVCLALMTTNARAAQRLPVQVAELIEFSGNHGKNMESWARALPMSPAHKREVAAYLTGHSVNQAPLPRLRWKYGTNALSVDHHQIDFAKLEKHQLGVNGKYILVGAGDSLESLVQKFGKAFNSSTAQLSWFTSVAEAADLLTPVYAAWSAISYLTGSDLADACDGDEATSRLNCVVKKDEKMIAIDLGPDTNVAEFTCEGDQFTKISTVSEGGYTEGLALGYEKTKLNSMTTTRDGAVVCRFGVEGDTFTSVKAESNDDGCYGRTTDEYEAGPFHLLAAGDKPRAVALTVPLQRLQNCCKSNSCKSAMAELVKQSATAGLHPTAIRPPYVAPPIQVSKPDDDSDDDSDAKQ